MTFKTLRLDSPFKDNRKLFDSTESNPDLTFVIPNRPHPVHVHRAILSEASDFVCRLLRCKSTAGGDDQGTIQWSHEQSCACEPIVIFNVLRFFYGYSLDISCEGEELCATLATIRRFQARCDDVPVKIESFAKEQAKLSSTVGAQLLLACPKYLECCSDKCGGFHKKLAGIVLTAKNMEANPKIVVDACFAQLPLEFQDLATFGPRGTPSSEFSVWVRCLTTKRGPEYQDARECFLEFAEDMRPSSKELKLAWSQGVVGDELLHRICFKSWFSEEEENKALRSQLERMKEREEVWEKNFKKERAARLEAMEQNEVLQRRLQLLEDELASYRTSSARSGGLPF